jgi:hypothetical protein
LQGKPLVDKVSNTRETEAGTEISVLVNYCQSVQFTSFENAESEYFILKILVGFRVVYTNSISDSNINLEKYVLIICPVIWCIVSINGF